MISGDIVPVILCGGSGTRLWPLSRKSYPKQFLKLNSKSERSLLQQTQERLSKLSHLKQPILICNEEHRFIAAEQMREINVKPQAIILETIAKNTAPAITLAALKALEVGNDPVLIILAADHLINQNHNFLNSLERAFEYAIDDKLVTFGVIPTYAETGYGYIESEEELNLQTLEGVNIKKFIEKPDKSIAEKLILEKKYSWNSGMFVFKAKTFIDELKKFEPKILSNCIDSLKMSAKDLDFERVNNDCFSKCPSISIDNAVMEKTKSGIVVPLDAKWSDIGNWKSLWEYEEKNSEGNVIQGKVLDKEIYNCFVKSESKLIVGYGLKNLIIVETTDAILIADKNYVHNLKELVEELKANKIEEATVHKKAHRPWGNYFSVASGKTWQVKKIEVKPGAALSLQMHYHRAEHWIVVSGTALVEIDGDKKLLSKNQSVYVPLGSKHRLSNPGKLNLILIEVQSGSYLGEDDIHRFVDDYGR